ncbi:hypothetical protein FGG08_007555, partial [Glutinoglossum americanum]
VVVDLATTVEETDHVSVDGKKQKPDQPYTLAMFKPEGVLCSRDAQGRRRTVFDLLPEDSPRLFYVGRLDMDSEGLLILTNQGELAQQLTHPSFKLPKVYHVELDKDFDFALVPRFLKGFLIEPGYAQAEAVYKLGHNRVKVVLTQGLKRQIRLMFLKFGYRVKFLRRIEIGSLSLGNMKQGEWRFLNDYEIKKLLLTPSVREEDAPKTFGKTRDPDKEVPEAPVKKVRAPNLRDRIKRTPRRPAFSERTSRPSRPVRPSRFGGNDDGDRPERSSRTSGPARPTGSTRFSRTERPARPERAGTFERPGRSSRPLRSDRRPGPAGDSASDRRGPDRSKRFARPEREGRPERGSRPERAGVRGKSSERERPSRPAFGRSTSRPPARSSSRPGQRSSRPPRR